MALVRLPDGRIRESRPPGPNGWPRYFYYYPVCQVCKRRKGKSAEPVCRRCAYGPRSGIRLHCPHCKGEINRTEVMVAMSMAGISAEDIGHVFNLSTGNVARHVRRWRDNER